MLTIPSLFGGSHSLLVNKSGGSGYSTSGRDFFVVSLNRSDPPNNNNYDTADEVAIGSDGSIYGCGSTGSVFKFNSSGSLQWQRTYDIGDNWNSIALDSSDSVYVTNRYNQGIALLAKWNSSGTFQWVKELKHSSWSGNSLYTQPQDVTVDSNNNVYMVGYILTGGTPSYRMWVAKYDTSGNLIWVNVYGKDASQSIDAYGCTTDSSGNIYVTGQGNAVNNYYNEPYVAKINSSGTPQWYSSIIGPYSASYGNNYLRGVGFGVELDSSGNVYMCGRGNRGQGPGTQRDMMLVKFNSSGNHQWNNFSGTDSSADNAKGLIIDDEDKIYITGNFRTSPNQYNAMCICKFDGSGTLEYRRLLRCHGLNDSTNALINYGNIPTLDSNRDLYVAGYIRTSLQDPTNGGYEIQIAKLPSDGTFTGTHGDYIYEDPTHTTSYSTTSTSIFSTSETNLVNLNSNVPMTGANFTTNIPYNVGTFTAAKATLTATGSVAAGSGQQEYTTAGTYSWTCPAGVTSVCVVCIGGGGASNKTGWSGGGGGGGLGYKNNISVTPGQSYTVVVGAAGVPGQSGVGVDGGDSYFINTSTVKGGGGMTQIGYFSGTNATGGTYVGDGGGDGGKGGYYWSGAAGYYGGGGGAGGYSGAGGNGGTNVSSWSVQVSAGSGGGGGGGWAIQGSVSSDAGGGGGTGLQGEGTSGAAGTSTANDHGGKGGSGGDNATGMSGGNYGGGSTGGSGPLPAGGAVRIIWGAGRAFPSTNTADVSPVGQQAYVTPGSYTWTAPNGVTSVSVVCVGGGSGCGAALAYKNNITVVPGNSYSVVVGDGGVNVSGAGNQTPAGGDSSFSATHGTTTAQGGSNAPSANKGNPAGQYDGGGSGGITYSYGAFNGGGAGGYSGNGGGGGSSAATGQFNGSGGGGGAGHWAYSSGGGVGIYGEGASGLGGSSGDENGEGGSGGSGGNGPGNNGGNDMTGGLYGGGTTSRWAGNKGGHGAVRIIWPGNVRQFPSTRTADE